MSEIASRSYEYYRAGDLKKTKEIFPPIFLSVFLGVEARYDEFLSKNVKAGRVFKAL